MPKKKAAKIETTTFKGTVARTNRFFLQLKAYGNCDDSGRTIMGIEFSTKKMIAPPDKPLKLISHILDGMINGISYSNKDAALIDIEEFQRWALNLQVDGEPVSPNNKPAT